MRDQALREKGLYELHAQPRKLGIVGATLMPKEEIIRHIMDVEQNPNKELEVCGVLEKLSDGFWLFTVRRFRLCFWA